METVEITYNLLSCQYSYELLLQFLHKSQSTTILGIINEHINFQGISFLYLCKIQYFLAFYTCDMYAWVLGLQFLLGSPAQFLMIWRLSHWLEAARMQLITLIRRKYIGEWVKATVISLLFFWFEFCAECWMFFRSCNGSVYMFSLDASSYVEVGEIESQWPLFPPLLLSYMSFDL